MVITNRGGTYLVDKGEGDSCSYYLDSDADYICITLGDNTGLSNYTVIAWLKSKAFLWYITRLTGTTKLYSPKVYNSKIIPNIKCLNPGGEIEKISKKILEYEGSFLERKDSIEEKAKKDGENEEQYLNQINACVDLHNKTINGMFNQIDEIIFNELQINERQKEIINNDLTAFGLAIQSIEDDGNIDMVN